MWVFDLVSFCARAFNGQSGTENFPVWTGCAKGSGGTCVPKTKVQANTGQAII